MQKNRLLNLSDHTGTYLSKIPFLHANIHNLKIVSHFWLWEFQAVNMHAMCLPGVRLDLQILVLVTRSSNLINKNSYATNDRVIQELSTTTTTTTKGSLHKPKLIQSFEAKDYSHRFFCFKVDTKNVYNCSNCDICERNLKRRVPKDGPMTFRSAAFHSQEVCRAWNKVRQARARKINPLYY